MGLFLINDIPNNPLPQKHSLDNTEGDQNNEKKIYLYLVFISILILFFGG